MTLRTVAGLTTAESDQAFLVPERRWPSDSGSPSRRSQRRHSLTGAAGHLLPERLGGVARRAVPVSARVPRPAQARPRSGGLCAEGDRLPDT